MSRSNGLLRSRYAFFTLIATLCCARPTDAQRVGASPFRASAAADSNGWVFPRTASPASPSGWVILASALVPGAGQALLGQRRAIPYMAVEVFAWTSYARSVSSARSLRDDYRGLAVTSARSQFTPVAPVGDFAYYERMLHFAESGAFSLAMGADIEPEVDTLTFNGAAWLLARRTYWSDPTEAPDRSSDEWRLAESFYRSRAIPPEYRWSWRGKDADYRRFRSLIDRSNDAFRGALQDLGLVIGNHLLSTVDAYVTVRLHRRDAQSGSRGFSVTASVPF